jgi:tetratricopeptide (TPR) repeat protein
VLQKSVDLLLQLTQQWQRSQVLQNLVDEFQHDAVIAEFLGQVLEQEGNREEAKTIYTMLLKSNPRSKPAHLGLARIFEAQTELEEALLQYRRLIDLDDQDSTAYAAVVRIATQTGSNQTILEEWQLKQKADPHNKMLQRFVERLQASPAP